MFVTTQNQSRSRSPRGMLTKLFFMAALLAALMMCCTSTVGVDGFMSSFPQPGTADGSIRSWQTRHRVNFPLQTGGSGSCGGPVVALTRLLAAKDGGGTGAGGGGKKRRRKRKRKQNQNQRQQQQQPASQMPSVSGGGADDEVTGAAAQKIRVQSSSSPGQGEVVAVMETKQGDNDVKSTTSGSGNTVAATAEKSASSSPPAPKDATSTTPTKKLSFDRSEALALGIEDATDPDDIPPDFASLRNDNKPPGGSLPKLTELSAGRTGSSSLDRGAVELPDIKDSVKRKKTKAKKTTQVDDADQERESKERIQRTDVASFTKLLEIEPNADTDASYFVEEDYGTVSALLGEGAKSFLGIPLPILQVGHFIGALGIVLCAFVEYPGFPLTNLPSVVRGSLQGGLATVYAVNTVLAVLAAFKAGERGQPLGLWIIKTFTVGGLAYDQLMQLPTTDEMNAARRKKGKRGA